MEKALLIVSFGTSYLDSWQRDIQPVEDAIARAFPDTPVFTALGSKMIQRILEKRHGIQKDNLVQALEKLVQLGVQDLVVQPTFLIPGTEYDKLLSDLRAYLPRFRTLRLGKPLLWHNDDFIALADSLAGQYPKDRGTVIFMGHGTEHFANAAYPALQTIFAVRGCSHIHVGTVEGYPDLDLLCSQLQSAGTTHVTLVPLLLVAGDHALNDMASDEPDSWKSRLQKLGITADCIQAGLGSLEFVQQLYADHALKAAPLE